MTPDESHAPTRITTRPPLYDGPPYDRALTEPPVANPLTLHARILGVCWCVLGAFLLGIGLYFIAFAGVTSVAVAHSARNQAASESPDAPEAERKMSALHVFGTMAGAGGAFSFVFLCLGGLEVAAGVGLLRRATWGRPTAIAASIPGLISFPFGTILAIYTLIMLLRPGAKAQYQALCMRGFAS